MDPIAQAYMTLLLLDPGHPFRLDNQHIYAALRDDIAKRSGDDPENIQNAFETVSRTKGKL